MPQGQPPAGRRELHRVRGKVVEDLPCPADVDVDGGVPAGLDVEAHAGALRRLPGRGKDGAREVVERRQLRVELHPAGLDLREVENVVDERQQVLAGSVDVREVAALPLAQGIRELLAEQLREAEDRVERRPQLVAHAREELALGLRRVLGGRARLARR